MGTPGAPATPAAVAGAAAVVTPEPSTATAAAPAGARPKLAIIIDDCGQWPATERGFVALPIPITLSVLPYVRYAIPIARAAAAAGKGVMLHLPMENTLGRFPGPGEITTEMGDAAIRAQVQSDLADIPFARGVNNHEGSRATADPRVMADVAEVLAGDGRFFIDSRTTSATVAEVEAREHGVPTARRNVFLDDVDNERAVETQLLRAAALARADGSAIAVGHPRVATLAAVRALTPRLAGEGIDFVLAGSLTR